jgi:acyl-CoA thioesterase-1
MATEMKGIWRLARGFAVLALLAACKPHAPPARPDSTTAEASPLHAVATDAGVSAEPRAAGKTVLFLGTSLTAGLGLEPEQAYPMLIQHMLDSAGLPFRVVNAGVSGETSSGLLRRVDWLLQQKLGVVVIETGANDGLRGVPVDAMRANLKQIIRRIRAAQPDVVIALVQMEAMPNMGQSYTDAFRAAFPELAREENVHLLPFLLDGVAGDRELNQADGIHPNAAGERIVARNVWKALKPLLR